MALFASSVLMEAVKVWYRYGRSFSVTSCLDYLNCSNIEYYFLNYLIKTFHY